VKSALIILCVFAAPQLFAREQALRDSFSPDKRYRVTVVEIEGRVSYRIIDASSHVTVLSLRSSYQQGAGNVEDWGFKKSLGATVYWRKDSRCVAIDEANHNREGTVLVVRRTPKGFRQVPLSDEALTRASKMPWDRCRLFFGQWGSRDTIIVGLLGRVFADPESTAYKDANCGFTIALASGDVISIDAVVDAKK
jgi:hypothetical protein